MDYLLPSEADAIARELTNGRLHVKETANGVYLIHEATRDRVQLLRYQMTAEGLDMAIAEFWEPQNA